MFTSRPTSAITSISITSSSTSPSHSTSSSLSDTPFYSGLTSTSTPFEEEDVSLPRSPPLTSWTDPLVLFETSFPSYHVSGTSHFPALKPTSLPRRRSLFASAPLPPELAAKLNSSSDLPFLRPSSAMTSSHSTFLSNAASASSPSMVSMSSTKHPSKSKHTVELLASNASDESLVFKMDPSSTSSTLYMHYMYEKEKKLEHPIPQLIMTSLYAYRRQLEEKSLITTASDLLEKNPTHPPSNAVKLGHDVFGLTMTLPNVGPLKNIERVFYPTLSPDPSTLPHLHPYLQTRQRELQKALIQLDPLYGRTDDPVYDFYLQGHSPSPSTFLVPTLPNLSFSWTPTPPHLPSNTCTPRSSSTLSSPMTSSSSYVEVGPVVFEPDLVSLSTQYLSFESTLEEVTVSAITVYNMGPTAVHFTGHLQSQGHDHGHGHGHGHGGTGGSVGLVFYVHPHHGVVLPTSTFTVHVYFKAEQAGAYACVYSFLTQPKCPAGLQVQLHGMCFHSDDLAPQREAWLQDFHHRVACTAVHCLVNDVLDLVWDTIAYRRQKQPKRLTPRDIFESKNKPNETLPWSPTLDYQCHQFYQTHHAASSTSLSSWDGALTTLYQLPTPCPFSPSTYFMHLNAMLLGHPQSSPRKDWKQVYVLDTLMEISEHLHVISWGVRLKLGLPLDRPCLWKWSKAGAGVHELCESEEHAVATNTSGGVEQGKGTGVSEKKQKGSMSSKDGTGAKPPSNLTATTKTPKPISTTTSVSSNPTPNIKTKRSGHNEERDM
ncbi:hypothetical protein HMI56_003888 [Coelomomyces lativittatus]|nr:hypothetical protein HMI56_003888 [Coelomomyces lativittatus]